MPRKHNFTITSNAEEFHSTPINAQQCLKLFMPRSWFQALAEIELPEKTLGATA